MADLYSRAERLMGMTDAVWLRHMSNWSVWTRMLVALPLLTLALWSRVWIGWLAIGPVVLALGFIWLNPRLFAAPKTYDHWAARGVLGERVWLRQRDLVAPHHARVCRVLTTLSGLGAVVWIWGILWLDPWPTLLGMVMMTTFKTWFVDRMAWVWDDFQRAGGTIEALRDQ